jgi:hypothetical protein
MSRYLNRAGLGDREVFRGVDPMQRHVGELAART